MSTKRHRTTNPLPPQKRRRLSRSLPDTPPTVKPNMSNMSNPSLSSPHSIIPCISPSTTPPPPSLRVSLPTLPLDIWHSIAELLPPSSLSNLAQTALVQKHVAHAARDTLFRDCLTVADLTPDEGGALGRLLHRLHTSPSLRHKHVSVQMHMLARGACDADDDGVHFSVEQAGVFFGVQRKVLMGFTPACVKGVKMRRRRACPFAFAAFPPDVGRDAVPVYGLRSVLRAARKCHGSFEQVEKVVHASVREDEARFERAGRAETVVKRVAEEWGVPSREVEYALSASERVVEFRQGRWKGEMGRYEKVVRELFQVHVGLGGCYKCLLICDGKARLKAKRIVGKLMKNREEVSTKEIVDALEGNLWWARSKTNVQKMEEMSRNMPHIRV